MFSWGAKILSVQCFTWHLCILCSKWLLMTFGYFVTVFFLSLLNTERCLYILDASILWGIWFGNTMFQCVAFFHAFIRVLSKTNFFNFDSLIYEISILWIMLLVWRLSTLLSPRSRRFLLFSEYFLLLHFTFVFNEFWINFYKRCEV